MSSAEDTFTLGELAEQFQQVYKDFVSSLEYSKQYSSYSAYMTNIQEESKNQEIEINPDLINDEKIYKADLKKDREAYFESFTKRMKKQELVESSKLLESDFQHFKATCGKMYGVLTNTSITPPSHIQILAKSLKAAEDACADIKAKGLQDLDVDKLLVCYKVPKNATAKNTPPKTSQAANSSARKKCKELMFEYCCSVAAAGGAPQDLDLQDITKVTYNSSAEIEDIQDKLDIQDIGELADPKLNNAANASEANASNKRAESDEKIKKQIIDLEQLKPETDIESFTDGFAQFRVIMHAMFFIMLFTSVYVWFEPLFYYVMGVDKRCNNVFYMFTATWAQINRCKMASKYMKMLIQLREYWLTTHSLIKFVEDTTVFISKTHQYIPLAVSSSFALYLGYSAITEIIITLAYVMLFGGWNFAFYGSRKIRAIQRKVRQTHFVQIEGDQIITASTEDVSKMIYEKQQQYRRHLYKASCLLFYRLMRNYSIKEPALLMKTLFRNILTRTYYKSVEATMKELKMLKNKIELESAMVNERMKNVEFVEEDEEYEGVQNKFEKAMHEEPEEQEAEEQEAEPEEQEPPNPRARSSRRSTRASTYRGGSKLVRKARRHILNYRA